MTTAMGCYSSIGDMTSEGQATFQSSGHCGPICSAQGQAVMALYQGKYCFCGNLLPPPSDKTSDSACDIPCQGYDSEPCGGESAYSVLLTGLNPNPGTQGGSDGDPSSQSSVTPDTSSTPIPSHAPTSVHAITHVTPTVVTVGGSTVVKTLAPVTLGDQPLQTSSISTPSSDSSGGGGSGGGSSKVGIAVGVVVGILALIAIVAGVIMYLRHKNRKERASLHRRNAESLNAFAMGRDNVAGVSSNGLPPTGGSDSRLDPGILMQERRLSGGSVFADNKDYSRRILKVANPDED